MESRCDKRALVLPEIDRTRCEGKADCVAVCPYDVFTLRRLAPDELSALPLFSRLKARVHGGRQAFATKEQDCHALRQPDEPAQTSVPVFDYPYRMEDGRLIVDTINGQDMIAIERERALNQRDTGNYAVAPYLSRKQALAAAEG